MTRGTLLVDTAPADSWEDAFPVGNGRHGALPLGRPGAEQVIVTHHRLTWPDALAAPDGPPNLAGSLGKVRELLLAGKSRRALELFGGGWPRHHPRPFHPALAVNLTEAHNGLPPRGYRRTLSYRAGIAVTRWPGRRHTCFASRVHDVVVQHVRGTGRRSGDPGSADSLATGAWDAVVTVNPRLPGAPAGLRVSTELCQLAADDAVIVTIVEYPGTADNGGYAGATRVTFQAGAATPEWRGIRVTGCRELTLLTRVELFRDGSGKAAARDRAMAAVTAVPARTPGPLLAEHARAHAAAFGDVALDLGAAAADRRLPIGELLDRQAPRSDDPPPALLEKLFDSGRYLLLSASGQLPPRLTGLWQGDWDSAWSGAITTDANLGLQLAGAVSTAVPAAVDAVANLISGQLDDWRVNARRLFGARGIVAPAHTDGTSGLTTHFEPRWPLHAWTAAADWLLVPLLDEALARDEPRHPASAHPAPAHPVPRYSAPQYSTAHATGDNTAYPAEKDTQYDTGYSTRLITAALVELATFYEDFLVREDTDGHVIFAPSYSPENAAAGWAPMAVNATMDIAAARHALRAAARTSGAAQPDVQKWNSLADRLPPYRLTPDGALAEWAWPPAGSGAPPLPGDDDHRHVSHLYPVWPLHEITVAGTPGLAAAALRALRRRGGQDDSAHGYLHKALAAARLRDAGLAGRLLTSLIGQGFFFRSLMSSHYPKRSVYNADAACALPGVLAEMLVDSFPGEQTYPRRIELLPAVPAFLSSGRLRGFRTLAGVQVAELRWDTATREAEAVLVSVAGCTADISCWGSAPERRVTLPPGLPVRMSWGNNK